MARDESRLEPRAWALVYFGISSLFYEFEPNRAGNQLISKTKAVFIKISIVQVFWGNFTINCIAENNHKDTKRS